MASNQHMSQQHPFHHPPPQSQLWSYHLMGVYRTGMNYKKL